MKYRPVAKSFEAIPSYLYVCFICKGAIRGAYVIKNRWTVDGYPVKGQQVVDVLRNGQVITVHETCNL